MTDKEHIAFTKKVLCLYLGITEEEYDKREKEEYGEIVKMFIQEIKARRARQAQAILNHCKDGTPRFCNTRLPDED